MLRFPKGEIRISGRLEGLGEKKRDMIQKKKGPGYVNLKHITVTHDSGVECRTETSCSKRGCGGYVYKILFFNESSVKPTFVSCTHCRQSVPQEVEMGHFYSFDIEQSSTLLILG